jgi:hypothetical protein
MLRFAVARFEQKSKIFVVAQQLLVPCLAGQRLPTAVVASGDQIASMSACDPEINTTPGIELNPTSHSTPAIL